MFSRMRPYELFLAADRSQKYARRLRVIGVIRNRSRATGAGAGVACHVRSNAVC